MTNLKSKQPRSWLYQFQELLMHKYEITFWQESRLIIQLHVPVIHGREDERA